MLTRSSTCSATVTALANLWYSDLYGTIYGPYHCFNVPLPTTCAGGWNDETVTVTAINVGAGGDTQIGSADVA